MKVRKGDKVKVIAGKYKNTVSTVIEVRKSSHQVVVENVNVRKRAVKKTETNNENFVYFPHPIHISNVVLADEKDAGVEKKASKKTKKTTKSTKTKSEKK